MNTPISFIIFTALMLIILFLLYAYQKQKMINSFLVKEIEIKGCIKMLSDLIKKRQSHLDVYDFQLYNLDDALFEQDFPDFKKNTYF